MEISLIQYIKLFLLKDSYNKVRATEHTFNPFNTKDRKSPVIS